MSSKMIRPGMVIYPENADQKSALETQLRQMGYALLNECPRYTDEGSGEDAKSC